jgi:hypothetical protein
VLKPTKGAPFGLWYRNREYAVSYAAWIARELDSAETRNYGRDGTLEDRRVFERAPIVS